MSEIDDLEFNYSADTTATSTSQRIAGLKHARRIAEGAGKSGARKAFYNESRRTAPSLPRLKFLERAD